MPTDGAVLGAERILVIGGGALGLVFAAFLSRSGRDVQILAREHHARAIRERGGIEVETDRGCWTSPAVRADWRGARMEPADVAIVVTKAPDTAGAVAAVAHALVDVRVAVSLQNGVEKDALLAAAVGPGRVVGGVTMAGGALVGPGAVRHSHDGVTFVGELDGLASDRVERLAGVLDAAGMSTVATDRIRSVEWAKLAIAASAQAVSALTRRYYHEVLIEPPLASLVARLARETVAVARAAGVDVEDWSGVFAARSVADGGDDAVAILVRTGEALVAAGRTDVKPSMLQSLEQGGVMEIDALQGFVVSEARRLGIAVPAMELCHGLLVGLDTGRTLGANAVGTEEPGARRD